MSGVRHDGKPYRVLVIDDSGFIAKQLSYILTSEGFEVAGTVPDGALGVHLYQEMHPDVDLVTMDIAMPKMDGITALERIIAFDKNAVVLMVSAGGRESLVKKAITAGAKGFIVKPLDRTRVLERILIALR
jgi:two-component system chemotaxis response regulator CheY